MHEQAEDRAVTYVRDGEALHCAILLAYPERAVLVNPVRCVRYSAGTTGRKAILADCIPNFCNACSIFGCRRADHHGETLPEGGAVLIPSRCPNLRAALS